MAIIAAAAPILGIYLIEGDIAGHCPDEKLPLPNYLKEPITGK